jgi:hypothetical protein
MSHNLVMRNIFTQEDINDWMVDFFRGAEYSHSVKVTPADKAYYHILRNAKYFGSKLRDVDDKEDPFEELETDAEYTLIDISGFQATERDKLIQPELDFMDALGLIVKRGTQHFISPYAYLFYDVSNGLFSPVTYQSDDSVDLKQTTFAPIMRFFMTYVLPGRYWRARYARMRLPDNIYESHTMDRELRELEDVWQEIYSVFNKPDQPVEQ